MPRASIVYWYPEERLKHDGGARRVRAWQSFLERDGWDVTIDAVWFLGGDDQPLRRRRLSDLKKSAIPMPLLRPLPEGVASADLVVVAVPAVFKDALRRVPRERIILDWMDLWSANALSVGRESWLSFPGGAVQSLLWRFRERRWIEEAGANVFASYADFESVTSWSQNPNNAWLAIPVGPAHSPGPTAQTRAVGFIGNLGYLPNEIALRKFLHSGSEALERAQLKLVVAGYGTDRVRSWGYPVDVLGEIADVADFYSQIDAAVVPVDVGGGIKVKAIEAMSRGKAVIGTSHVADGFPPPLRPYIHPVNALNSPNDIEAVPQRLFEEYFSSATFDRQAAEVLERLRHSSRQAR